MWYNFTEYLYEVVILFFVILLILAGVGCFALIILFIVTLFVKGWYIASILASVLLLSLIKTAADRNGW